jgi:hypothetical protein
MVFPRETKFTQQLGMSELARKLDLKHFRHIRTFMTNAERPSSHFFGQDIGGMIVIKPIDGARGIGQLIVNLDEILPANVAHLLTLAKDGKDAFLEYVNTCAPHVEYHIGHGEVEEGIGALAEGYVVQEMVRNVENEYRIILTPESEPAFICARKRDSLPLDANANSHDYRQATGVARFRHEMAILSTIDYPHLNEVLVLLKELQLPLNSVDLFITTDGKWGIFEYCPQWGTQGLPLKDITDWLIAQVVGFLKQKDRHD